MAVPTTRATTTDAKPANGNTPAATAEAPKRAKAPPTPPEKRKLRVTVDQYLRVACGQPRSFGELVDIFDEADAGTIGKALKALEAQGVVIKQDGKWLRKPAAEGAPK